jgi:hypothetical protein
VVQPEEATATWASDPLLEDLRGPTSELTRFTGALGHIGPHNRRTPHKISAQGPRTLCGRSRVLQALYTAPPPTFGH